MFDTFKNIWDPFNLAKGEAEGHPFRGNQWTEDGGEGSTSSKINGVGDSGINGISEMVSQAITESPGRASHGYTAKSAFYIVGDKVYAWNEWNNIPKDSRGGAVPVHSHSAENYKDLKNEPFQPLNASDVQSWLQGFKKGQMGTRSVIIMGDGRMEALELTTNTDRKVFSMGLKKLEQELEPTYAERSAYYEKHKDDPGGYKTYEQNREWLRSFANEHGITYHENLKWK